MNGEVMESFINTCDELMIPAEESVKEMNSVFKENLKKIESLKGEINKTDDIKRQKDLIQNCINELKNAYSQIQKMDESTFDKAIHNIVNFIEIGIILSSGLAVGIKTKKIGAGVAASLGTGIVMGAASMKVDSIKAKNGVKKYTKPAILDMLKNEISWYERYLKVLSDPKYLPYLQKSKGSSTDKIESAYASYGDDSIGKIMKPMIAYIKSIIEPYALKKYNLKLQWMYEKDEDWKNNLSYTIRPTGESIDKIESIYRDPDSSDERMMSDIASKFDNAVDSAAKKFKIHEYGFEIEEQPDEYCEVYVRRSYHRNDYAK